MWSALARGTRADSSRVCSSFLRQSLMPLGTHGNDLHAMAMKRACFPRICCCQRLHKKLSKADTWICLVVQTRKMLCVHGPDLFVPQGELPLRYSSGTSLAACPSAAEAAAEKNMGWFYLFTAFQAGNLPSEVNSEVCLQHSHVLTKCQRQPIAATRRVPLMCPRCLEG